MATSLHAWQLNPISLSPLACLLAWKVQAEPQRAPDGLQKGTPKSPKIDQKSTRAALGMSKGVRGYPPGASEAPNMHFYTYLRIFMHIFAIFCAYLCICCAYLDILVPFSLVLCIFMHIVVHFTNIYAYLRIFMHIQTYL